MPRVPQTGNVVPMQPQAEMPSPTLFAMAAAMMHAEGRFDPILKGTAVGEFGNPAELLQGYKDRGASREDARRGVMDSMEYAAKKDGRDFDKELEDYEGM